MNVVFPCDFKIKLCSECYNQFDIYQPFCVFPLEPQQNNLSNPQTYSEPCQTSKMKCFAKIVNGFKGINIFC